MPFYAVRRGRKPGIYNTWNQCSEQINHFQKPEFRKFMTYAEAQAFLDGTTAIQKTVQNKTNKQKSHFSSEIPADLMRDTVEKFSTKKSSSTTTIPVIDLSNDDDESNYQVVYSDGCCFGNGQVGSRAGCGVYWGEQHPWNLSERLRGDQTNQRAELTAAIRAMETALQNGIRQLEIRTDSKYTIQSATEWIHGWKKNNWIKKSDSKPVMNQDLMIAIDELQQKLKVKWTYVAGHSSNKGNDEADRLAKAGANKS